MARTRQVTDNAMRSVERSTQSSMRRLEGIIGGVGTKLKAGIAGIFAGLSVGEVQKFADSYIRVQNALKVAGLQGEQLRTTYQSLLAISQRQGAPLEAMSTLYGRLAQSQKELNVTNADMLRFTEGVGMALRVQGVDAQTASGALLQLSQAMASGTVRAEEFNSINEGALPILKAVAAGMVEAGGSVGKLRELVNDGKISSQAFFRAFEAGMPTIAEQATRTEQTSSQAISRIGNSFTDLVGKLDEATRFSRTTAGALNAVADALERLGKLIPNASGALVNVEGMLDSAALDTMERKLVSINEQLRIMAQTGEGRSLRARGLAEQAVALEAQIGASRRKTSGTDPALTAQGAVDDQRGTQRYFPVVKPIKASDYAPPAKPGKDKSSREKIDEYEREVAAIGRRTRALDAERETVGKSAGDVAKAEAAFRLLEAAKTANVTITPQILSDIDAMATKYGAATQAIENAREAQERVADAMHEIGQTLSSAFTDAIVEGEKLDDVMKKLLKSLASKGIDSIFNSLFSGGSGGTGLLGQILGFGTGKASGGPVRAGVPYTVGESGRETFVPTTPGRIIPNGKGGGSVVVNMAPTTVHAPSGDPQLIAAMLDQRDRAMVAKLPSLIRNAQQRGQIGR